jgi:DNA mismatch endonuclease (patch repair protein)
MGTDNLSRAKRSDNMSKIRGKNTKPEKYVRSLLHTSGLRFRVNYPKVTGCPDLFFTRRRVAVFVHGCFWHRHDGCKYAYTPKSSTEFWLTKFEKNKARDEYVRDQLYKTDVRVLVVWECTIKKMMRNPFISSELCASIIEFVKSSDLRYLEI